MPRPPTRARSSSRLLREFLQVGLVAVHVVLVEEEALIGTVFPVDAHVALGIGTLAADRLKDTAQVPVVQAITEKQDRFGLQRIQHIRWDWIPDRHEVYVIVLRNDDLVA